MAQVDAVALYKASLPPESSPANGDAPRLGQQADLAAEEILRLDQSIRKTAAYPDYPQPGVKLPAWMRLREVDRLRAALREELFPIDRVRNPGFFAIGQFEDRR